MEAETTEKSEEGQDEIALMLNICASCKENFDKNREAKLLACLHTVCSTCLASLTVCESTDSENGYQLTKCPVCSHEGADNTVINNLFASAPVPATEDKAEEEVKCTGCEENVTAPSYCMECQEYLCDQCVQAHRRVKVTKDHNIQPKDNVTEAASTDLAHKHMHCPVHKQEELKLYCETCEKLTCRDCQLLEHKDHKYQFVDEAAQLYKQHLLSLLDKIRDKKAYVENAKALIGKRNDEIAEKEQKVASDIKTFIMKVATELNKRGKQLMTDLQSICRAKKGQLEKKNKEVKGLSSMLNYTLKFTEFCLEKGNNAALLYTKKLMNSQLRGILKTKCEVPNPYHVIDLKFGYDPKTPLIHIPTLGGIFVEGVAFNQPNVSQSQTSPSQSSSTQSMSNSQGQNPAQGQSHGRSQNQIHTSHQLSAHGGSSKSGLHEDLNGLSYQQKTAFLLKMKKMHEQRQQQQYMQQQQQQQQQQHQQMYKHIQQSTSPSSSTGLQVLQMMSQMPQQQPLPHGPGGPGPGSSHTQRLSHLPPQSSYISSSNSQNQRNHGSQPYYPPPLKGPHPLQQMQQQQHQQQQQHIQQQKRSEADALIKINLNQLHERRMGHQPSGYTVHHSSQPQPQPQPQPQHMFNQNPAPAHTTNNMQNPIVIQPTSDYSPERMPDSAIMPSPGHTNLGMHNMGSSPSLSDCMHSSRGSNEHSMQSMKPEEVARPSCSFAGPNSNMIGTLRLKHEPKTPQTPDPEVAPAFSSSHSSGSRTPTPRAESTTGVSHPTQSEKSPSGGVANIIPDLDNIANISTGSSSSVSDALTAILGSDLDSSVASEKVLETILGINSSKPPKEKPTSKGSDLPVPSGKPSTPSRASPARCFSQEDRSEDWCAVCHNGGDLLCCDGCPKVFHLTCHVPNLPKAPSEDSEWFCGLCTKEEDLLITEAPSTDPEPSQLSDRERKVCERILLELFSHEEAVPFQEPVSESVPNYYKIISNPMDLRTMKEKLSSDMYHSLLNFLKDVQLIFSNCSVYNLPVSEVGAAGKIVESFFQAQLKRYLPFVDPTTLLPPQEVGELLEASEPPVRKQKRSKSEDSEVVSLSDRRKKRTKSGDSDEEWVAEEEQSTEDSDGVIPKKRLKRKRDGHSSDSGSGSATDEPPIVHIQ